MTRAIYLIRFFRVVPPTPPLMGIAFTVATAMAAVGVFRDPDGARQALTPLLLLQLFACSSGFMIPARRGHYDLALTSGESRLSIASVHWMMSLLPGISGWLVVAMVETIVTGGDQVTTLASGSVVAWVLVSTLPWAVTVALPRFAGAIGWLLVLAVTAATTPGALHGEALAPDATGPSRLEAAVVLLVYPPSMVGESLGNPHGWLALPALLVAVVSMVCALGWIEHDDIPLEAAQ